jgi:DNA helicase II / ATP-dependent DNA helicase PcrA
MAREYTLHQDSGPASGIDYRQELNDSQYAAVTSSPGQALVIAGAGSGKTRTLTYRVAWLLDNGIPPENILLLTFTNKAAREMLERVQSLVAVDTRRMWGGTFHSVGNRLLRRHADLLGWRSGFSIMDREDQSDLMETVVANAKIDVAGFRFPKAEVLIDVLSLAENICASTKEVIDTRYPYFEPVVEQIKRVHQLYQAKKCETNSMDFDDLLALSVRLLREHESVREIFQRQFQFVLVDEYQDTNQLQCEMIDMLVGDNGNLMVVGDDAQSIYSWRGADVGNILGFEERYPKAQVFKIETNYRSVPEILTLANAAIAQNKRQIPKTLQPARPERGTLPALVQVHNPSAQASFVAQRILELNEEGIEFSEMAVLYRAHFHSLEIQLELTKRGIPYQITSGLRFFEQAHIKDVAAFIKFVVNPTDEVAFMRLVRLVPGIGGTSALKLWTHWTADQSKPEEASKRTLHRLLAMKVPKKAETTWQQFAYTLDELTDKEGKLVPPASMIQSIVEGVYADYMKAKFNNFEQRKDDLQRLGDYSSRFTDAADFLSQLALVSNVDVEHTANTQQETNVVTLTTGHQAKGLEWQAVFAIWLADGMFPNRRVLDSGDSDAIEEERRLFYVTVTRAKDELYLIYPTIYHQSRDGDMMQRVSRFIEDIDPDLMEVWNVRSF